MWRRSTGGWRTGSARTTRRSCVVSLAASLAGGGWRRSLVDGGTKDGGTLFLAIVPWSPRATLLAAVPWLPRLLTARTLSANRGGRTDGAQLYRRGAEAAGNGGFIGGTKSRGSHWCPRPLFLDAGRGPLGGSLSSFIMGPTLVGVKTIFS
jgi:hypothetical protein